MSLDYKINICINLSILIPATIAGCRWRSIRPQFYPFLLLLIIGAANECLSVFMVIEGRFNTINSNIYVALEYILLLAQYKYLGNSKINMIGLATIGLVVWSVDNMITHSLYENNFWFRIFYSIIIVDLGVRRINTVILEAHTSLISHPEFLFCIGCVLYYSFKSFFEFFNFYGSSLSISFYRNMFLMVSFVNLTTNMLFTAVALCTKKKVSYKS